MLDINYVAAWMHVFLQSVHYQKKKIDRQTDWQIGRKVDNTSFYVTSYL
jgi:hypothetical protein